MTNPAGARLGALLAAALVAGCAGSDPQPLELVAIDHFGDQASLLAGGAASSAIGYTATGSGSVRILRLVRHDPATPDRTVALGDVEFLGGTFSRLVVTDEAAVVNIGGTVRLVDLTVASLPVETLDGLGNAADVAVAGRWVLGVSGTTGLLVNRDAPANVALAFAVTGAPTALLAIRGVFVVFTTTGYVVVDPAAMLPGEEVVDPAVANVRHAFAGGATAVVAGPASSFGRSRVLRLDFTNPAAPVVVRSHEVPGSYVAFAWDGASAGVLAVHGEQDGADPRSYHQGYVVREGAGGFSEVGVPLTFWSQSPEPIAAHAGHLFAVTARGTELLRIR